MAVPVEIQLGLAHPKWGQEGTEPYQTYWNTILNCSACTSK